MNLFILLTGILLLVYSAAVNLLEGYIAFHAAMGVVGVLMILAVPIKKRLEKSRWGKVLVQIGLSVVGLGLAVMLVAEGFILSGVLSKNDKTPDYTVVLGAGLRGTELSDTLKRRLDTAISCDDGQIFVVTGGQGRGESLPEGEAMAAYLLSQGIEKDRILIENRSTSTWENFCYAKPIIEAHGGQAVEELSVAVVTSDFHCFRAKLIAKRAGYGELLAEGSKTDPLIAPGCYIREALALVKTLLFDR